MSYLKKILLAGFLFLSFIFSQSLDNLNDDLADIASEGKEAFVDKVEKSAEPITKRFVTLANNFNDLIAKGYARGSYNHLILGHTAPTHYGFIPFVDIYLEGGANFTPIVFSKEEATSTIKTNLEGSDAVVDELVNDFLSELDVGDGEQIYLLPILTLDAQIKARVKINPVKKFDFGLKFQIFPQNSLDLGKLAVSFEIFNFGLNTRYVLFDIPLIKVVSSSSFNVFTSKLELTIRDADFDLGNGYAYNLDQYRMSTEMLQTSLHTSLDGELDLAILRIMLGLGASLGTGSSYTTSTVLDGTVTYDTAYLVENDIITESEFENLDLNEPLEFDLGNNAENDFQNPLWGDLHLRTGVNLSIFSFRMTYGIISGTVSGFGGVNWAF